MDTSKQISNQVSAGGSAQPRFPRHASPRRNSDQKKEIDYEQFMIAAMRDLGWGRIEDVPVRGGTPRMTKDTKVLRRVRVGRGDAANKASWHHRTPHEQHHKLFATCRRIGDGRLARIEVSDGLPVHWEQAVVNLEQRAK